MDSSSQTARPGPILIVDDMPENLDILGRILGDAGYAVRAARSGEAALRYAVLEPRPELVLLDIMMPGMDGFEVLRQLRGQAATQDIPVLFLSALGDAEDIARGLREGAADYLTKPVQTEVVLARVRTQLEAKRVRDWLRDQNLVLENEVRRRVEEARRIQEVADHAQTLLNHQRELILASASDGIFGIDPAGNIHFINPAAAGLLGYGRDELAGRPLRELLHHAPGDENFICDFCLAGGEIQGREVSFWRKDGEPLSLELDCRPILDAGRVTGAVVTVRDHSERKRYLEQLERQANFDDLTGLPNRNLLHDRLAQAIGRARDAGMGLAVFAFNLDRFKGINDSLGHAAGDQVLVEMAARLRRGVAGTDTLARLVGDEFVLVSELDDAGAAHLAPALLARLDAPFLVGGHELFLTGSLGIALFPKDGETVDTLLDNATAALYRAKSGGGNRFSFYAAEMNVSSRARLDLENGLRRAIERGELVLHYQPQVCLRSGAIVGVEALVRWQHPEQGLLPPGQFISLAEESGLIVPLGEWVLRTACAQNKAWQEAGLDPVRMAVNMSARQFAGQDVVKLAADILAETGLAPGWLELELTESIVMADANAFIHATEQLKGLSISLSIDDFGTGFSSLSYLRHFGIDRLKIDQSFVRDITHDANCAAIARAVISLAHSLKLSALAEGVETEAQLGFLRRHDCDEMQGFYFSRPVPADAFAAMLRDRRRLVFPTGAPLPSRTLLLVDDEPSMLSALRRVFRQDGYTVLTAESGMAALEVLASQPVGVVLSDGRMPGMNGGEFLGQVRELYPDVIRMMLSGYTDFQAVTKAVNSGELFCFMAKPWDENELRDAVREAFRHHEARLARAGAGS